METKITLPVYTIDSDLIKLMLGVKDRRAIISRLKKLGVPIISRNNILIVRHQDLEGIVGPNTNSHNNRYVPKSPTAKGLKGGDH